MLWIRPIPWVAYQTENASIAPWIRGIDDVDEIVVALRVVDRLDFDAQLVELCLGLVDPLRLLACPLRAQIAKQHIFHGHLHVMLIILHEGPCNYTPSGDRCHAVLSPRFSSSSRLGTKLLKSLPRGARPPNCARLEKDAAITIPDRRVTCYLLERNCSWITLSSARRNPGTHRVRNLTCRHLPHGQ